MHPWHYRHFALYARRSPSRFVWFMLGAVTASFWIKHHEVHSFRAHYCSRHHIPQEAYPAPGAMTTDAQREETHKDWRWTWKAAGWRQMPEQHQPHSHNQSQSQERTPTPPPPSAEYDVPGFSDTISGFSEATLDRLQGTINTLRAKLAELRVHREKQDREMRELREAKAVRDAQMREYEEWRRQQDQDRTTAMPRHVV